MFFATGELSTAWNLVFRCIPDTVTHSLVVPSSPVPTGELSTAWNLVFRCIPDTVTHSLVVPSSPVPTGELSTAWILVFRCIPDTVTHPLFVPSSPVTCGELSTAWYRGTKLPYYRYPSYIVSMYTGDCIFTLVIIVKTGNLVEPGTLTASLDIPLTCMTKSP